jgi:hypothetical protein
MGHRRMDLVLRDFLAWIINYIFVLVKWSYKNAPIRLTRQNCSSYMACVTTVDNHVILT